MRRRGTLLVFIAAIWPLVARYFGEFFREFVFYEQVSKILHRLAQETPIDTLWQYGPSLLLAAIGVFFYFSGERQPPENEVHAPENTLCDRREWSSSDNILRLADPSLVRRVTYAEKQIERLARQIDDGEQLLSHLGDQSDALVLLQPAAKIKLQTIADRTTARLQMAATRQQLLAARAKAIEDVHKKLKSGQLIAKGFRHPIEHDPKETMIPAAHWRIIRFNGDFTKAQGQGIRYSGIAVARA